MRKQAYWFIVGIIMAANVAAIGNLLPYMGCRPHWSIALVSIALPVMLSVCLLLVNVKEPPKQTIAEPSVELIKKVQRLEQALQREQQLSMQSDLALRKQEIALLL